MWWGGKEGRKTNCFCWEKTPATQANYFIQIRRNKYILFLRSLRIWITANVSIYKISALVDIFHFQFSTSFPPYLEQPLIKDKNLDIIYTWAAAIPTRSKQRKTACRNMIYTRCTQNWELVQYLRWKKEKMLGLSVKQLTGFMILKLLLQSHRWKCFHVYNIRTFKNGSNAIVFETRGKTGMRKSFWYTTTEVSYEANKAWNIQSRCFTVAFKWEPLLFLAWQFKLSLSLNKRFAQPGKLF